MCLFPFADPSAFIPHSSEKTSGGFPGTGLRLDFRLRHVEARGLWSSSLVSKVTLSWCTTCSQTTEPNQIQNLSLPSRRTRDEPSGSRSAVCHERGGGQQPPIRPLTWRIIGRMRSMFSADLSPFTGLTSYLPTERRYAGSQKHGTRTLNDPQNSSPSKCHLSNGP